MLPLILVAGLALREVVSSRKLREPAPEVRFASGGDASHMGQTPSGAISVTVTQSDVDAIVSHADPLLKGLVDNDPMSADPNGVGAQWNLIATHIAADLKAGFIDQGKALQTAENASSALYQSITNFVADGASGNVAASGADLVACAGAVAVRYTTSGASQMLAGLAQQGIVKGESALADWATSAATPIVENAVNHLCGSFIASLGPVIAGAAAGALATGVGAVIGAALAVAGEVLSNLLSSPPPPPYQVGNCGMQTQPDIVVKYTWMWSGSSSSPVIAGGPSAPGWRSFPTPQTAPDWFQPWGWSTAVPYGHTIPGTSMKNLHGAQTSFGLDLVTQVTAKLRAPISGADCVAPQPCHEDTWYACYTFPNDAGTRVIDHAMYDLGVQGPKGADGSFSWQNADDISVYHQLETEQLTPIFPQAGRYQQQFKDFLALYFQLWKQNREFQLNGMQPMADYQVLQHTQTVWNGSHQGNVTLRLQPNATPPIAWNAPPLVFSTYAQWLMQKYQGALGTTLNSDFSLTLNMGPSIISHENLPPAGAPHLPPIRISPNFWAALAKMKKPATAVKVTLAPGGGGATPAGNVIGLLVLAGTLGTAALMQHDHGKRAFR
jgi:hypothetical protein